MDEGAVGPGLARNRTEIAIRDGKIDGESGKDGELGGTEGLHDFDGAIAARGVGVVDDESQVWPGRIGTWSFRSEELVSDVGEALFRIGIRISG